MSRYLLDTNILSDPTKSTPSQSLAAWLANQAEDDLFIASLTVAEIWRGVEEKPAGKRRNELERWFAGPNGPQSVFAGRNGVEAEYAVRFAEGEGLERGGIHSG